MSDKLLFTILTWICVLASIPLVGSIMGLGIGLLGMFFAVKSLIIKDDK
jgi:hypothetical protein